MKTITWDKSSYLIDGKPSFLISGEFHYFRVPETDWERRLSFFKKAGGNCIATYIPWVLHEPEEGRFLFGDKPERDLEGFLSLCGEMELFVICRPGPYQYSEMKYDGLPGWLVEKYSEILARDINGKPFRQSSVSYLHPVFLDKVKKWYQAVCPLIARYTLKNGGPVAFVQIDNELGGIHEWHIGLEYNKEAMGIGKKEGAYPSFLKRRYQNTGCLRQAYGEDFSAFEEIRPISGTPANIHEYRRMKDYQDFYLEKLADYAEILAGWMRGEGIDCDLIHNSGNPEMNPYFLETAARLGRGFLLGSDHYYNLHQDFPQNNPTPKYAVRVLCSLEMLRLFGFPPSVFELPAGSPSDWPPATPTDLMCCYMLNLALGMKGLNYYIFTGGPNPEGIGLFEIYDYGAAIGSDGEIRPLYGVIKKFNRFLRRHAWLARSERAVDFLIGLDWNYGRSRYYFTQRGEFEFANIEAFSFMQKGLLTSSLCASYSPGFTDLADEQSLLEVDRPVFMAASVCMPAKIQQRLVDFLQRGGRLVLAPVIPYLDENFNRCTILQDFLEGSAAQPYSCRQELVEVKGLGGIPVQGMYSSVKRPQGAVLFASGEKSGVETGWRLDLPGGGTLIWLGFYWRHARTEHVNLVRKLFSELGCGPPVVDCDNPNIWTSLRRHGRRKMLFAVNLFSAPMEAAIKVELPGEKLFVTRRKRFKPMEVKVFQF